MDRETEALNKVVTDNLAALDAENDAGIESRVAFLADRAALIARSEALGEGRSADFEGMFASRTETDTPHVPERIAKYLTGYRGALEKLDKLTVCGFLADRYQSGGTLPRKAEDEAAPKIAYLKNAYADDAFRRFSEVFEEPTVTYAADFTAVCEEVYYGRADMCILPLDSSRDAKLISFYRLIGKYELRIVMSCDVSSGDGVMTRYALLRKSAFLPSEKQDKKGELFFEFSFVPDESSALCDVLTAAADCGLKLYKVDALPLTYTDSEFLYDVILRCPETPEVFALYMSLAVPQYELLGVYRHMGAL